VPDITRGSKAERVVEEFLNSKDKAVRLEGVAPSFAVSLKKYVAKNEAPIRVVTRQGSIYLVKG
jgi:hypothetical protein